MSGLTNFIKRRLQDLHTDASAVTNTAKRVVVAPVVHAAGNVVHAGGNVVNAGATTARDLGGAAQATGRFVMATPKQNVVLPAVQSAAKATVKHFAVDLPKSVYDIGRGAAASVTGNQVALQHAHEAKAKDEGAFIQPIARPIIQTVRTIEHPFSSNSYQAKGRDAQVIFGKEPVQNVAAGVKTNFDEHSNLPMPQRLLLAGSYGGGQLLQDAAAVGGIKVAGHTLAEGAVDTGSKALKATKEIATGKPFRHVSDGELAAANRVSMTRSGFPDNTKPGDIETYRRIQQKLGVDPNDHGAIDNLIGARMTYDTRMSQRPKILQVNTEGGGKGTEYHGKGAKPHENFEKEYAGALEHMESGMTGGQMVPDGEGGYTRTSEHTPFYRKFYAETGHAPRKADYLAEAQRQLKSGKADSYAQTEYDGLKALSSKKTKPAPVVTADALKRSKIEDAPTVLSDALLAKKQKLDAAREAQVVPTTPQVAPGQVAAAPQLPMGAVHVDPTGQLVESKFPAHLMQEERTQPIQPALEDQAMHAQLKNKDVLAATGDNIAQNEDAALAFAKRGDSTEANATAIQLIDKYLSEGQFEKVSDLVKTVNPRFTRQGQETQILAAYSKLTPAGAVRYAQHEVDRAIEDSGKGRKLQDATKQTADNIKKVNHEVADTVADEVKNGKLGTQEPAVGGSEVGGTNAAPSAKKAGQTPEERLAARIKASTDKKASGPDPVTDMVNTLHKVAKEVLPADAAKTIPRDPMQLIGTAIKDEQNYHGVYDKAKEIVMERYKDNPEALAELDKYFGNDIKRTYAQSQVNQGVQSGLKGVDLGALVKQHFTSVDEVGKDLKTKLIERAGLDEASATQLAGDIQKRYNELVQQRKDSIIKQIFGEKPTPKQLSAVDKIFQYENLGALSRDELRPLVGEKLGVPSLSEDAIKEISDRANKIQQMPEGAERNRAAAEMLRFIADQVPQDKVQGALSVWKAGLLSGAKTQTGNLLSNATFGALKKVSDLPAAGLDAVLSKFTGKRTKTFTAKGIASGTAEGTRKGIDTLRTGLDERNYMGDKYDVHSELNFKNPIIQNVFGKPSNLVFRGMSAADQPFYYAAAKNSLNDMALAAAKTRGLKGAEADNFVKNLVSNPPVEMAERAKAAAEKAVLSQDSKIASSISRLAREHPSVQVLVPFIKVPTNFLSRTLDYTPVGYVKAAVKAIKDAKAGTGFDQRSFVEAVGEATTGSAVIYLGAELANHSMLSGAYPTDPKEQARWKAQGITPNSIHVGNKWISLNYLGPLGLLLGAGKSYHDAAADGNTGWTQALASFGQNLAGQSFLSGFNSFANALNDPSRYMSNLKNSEAGSLIPSWANDLAGILDNKQRNATTVPQTIQSRIPGARNKLPVKTDTYGNNLPQRTNAAQLTVDPTRPSNDLGRDNPVIQEVARLHNVDSSNKDLQVTPTAPTSVNIEGKTVKLDAKQKYDLNNKVGSAVQKKWGELIKTPEYKALDDAGKAKALSNLRSDITTLTERQFVLDNNLGVYNKAPGRAVLSLGQGQTDLGTYATKTQNSGSNGTVVAKTLSGDNKKVLNTYNAMTAEQRDKASYGQNDFDYKVALAKHENDVANNKLSKAGLIKAQSTLAKAKVGAGYTRDVRDLYGLSNDALSEYLDTKEPGVDKAAMAKQIMAYGDALASAGVITKNKFRTINGAVTLGTTSKGRGKSFKTVNIPSIKNNPYKTSGGKKTFKQVKLPTLKTKVAHGSYKTTKLSTNLNAKLRKA